MDWKVLWLRWGTGLKKVREAWGRTHYPSRVSALCISGFQGKMLRSEGYFTTVNKNQVKRQIKACYSSIRVCYLLIRTCYCLITEENPTLWLVLKMADVWCLISEIKYSYRSLQYGFYFVSLTSSNFLSTRQKKKLFFVLRSIFRNFAN